MGVMNLVPRTSWACGVLTLVLVAGGCIGAFASDGEAEDTPSSAPTGRPGSPPRGSSGPTGATAPTGPAGACAEPRRGHVGLQRLTSSQIASSLSDLLGVA